MTMEINKFPFTERSTLRLTELEYTLPLGIFTDANFYPVCQNNAPFHITEFIKSPDNVVATVADAMGSSVFTISFPVKSDNNNVYCIGVGMQGRRYCGSCLCTKEAFDFFDSIPSIRDIPSGSLVFTASAVRPVAGDSVTSGRIKYKGETVESVYWGDNLAGGTIEPPIIDTEDNKNPPITTVVVNGVTLTGPHLFITPAEKGVIRVVNTADIAIGRLTDL